MRSTCSGVMDADVPTDPRHSASRIAAKIVLFDHLVGAGEQRRRHVEAEVLAVLRLIMNSNLVRYSIGRSVTFASCF